MLPNLTVHSWRAMCPPGRVRGLVLQVMSWDIIAGTEEKTNKNLSDEDNGSGMQPDEPRDLFVFHSLMELIIGLGSDFFIKNLNLSHFDLGI